jgi:hypothetical protein
VGIDLAVVRTATAQLTCAILNPHDPAIRRETMNLREAADAQFCVIAAPGCQPPQADELSAADVVDVYRERLMWLLAPGPPFDVEPLSLRAALARVWNTLARDSTYKLLGPMRDEFLLALEALTSGLPPAAGPLELIDGGFAFRGRDFSLSGRPLAMLRELLAARHRRMTATGLASAMGVDPDAVTYPEQVVRDTAAALRCALRLAVEEADLSCEDPLPSHGRGQDLTYQLSLP